MASLEIAVGGYGLGLAIGIGGAAGKLYGGPVVKDLLAVYTTLVRAVPELVLIVLLYYAGTDAFNQLLAAVGFLGGRHQRPRGRHSGDRLRAGCLYD